MRVDLLQGRLERRLGAGVLAGAFRGGQPPVIHVTYMFATLSQKISEEEVGAR